MGYRVVYHNEKLERAREYSGRRLYLTVFFLCCFYWMVSFLWPEGKELLKILLIPGNPEATMEAAEVFAASGILLLGNESQTVGPQDAPMAVHLALLSAGVVLLEGIRLADVPDGVYLLNAAPLNLQGADGSPCRAVLISDYNG